MDLIWQVLSMGRQRRPYLAVGTNVCCCGFIELGRNEAIRDNFSLKECFTMTQVSLTY